MKKHLIGFTTSIALALGMLTLTMSITAGHVTAAPNVTFIYNIQYTTTPGGDGTYPSPYDGQTVTVEGIVHAVYGGGFCIADGSGPWHSIYVYVGGSAKPDVGDQVQVIGQVSEYYGLTELGNSPSVTVLSSGNQPYAPTVVTAADIQFDDPDVAEPYESVLVEVHDIEVTGAADTHGVWSFTDASSGAGKADDWGYHLEPEVGDEYYALRGALIYTYDWYRVMPRDSNDVVAGPFMAISKNGPANISSGDLYTYTIAITNGVGITLTNVVISDALPAANATLAYVLDGGTSGSGVVSWTIPSLSSGSSLDVRFAVTATGSTGSEIWNTNYSVRATEWPTPTTGAPLLTVIGDYTPIYLIQGDGPSSPLKGATVKTVGVVNGLFQGNYPGSGSFDGFFIQDPTGDSITTTSDGIFVNYGTLGVSVDVGDLVTVTGEVQEFSEWDGDSCSGDCLTQIAVSNAGNVTIGGTGSIAATVLDPPGDAAAGDTYWESLEGMLVTLPETGTVVGPTSYGTIGVVQGSIGISHVLRSGPYAGMAVAVRHWKRYGDLDNGSDPDNLIVGSVVMNVDGPLGFSYGNYLVTTQAGDAWSTVYDRPAPSPPPSWPAAGAHDFTVATFNVENFFDTIDDPGKSDPVISPADYAVHRDKIAATINQANCPLVVGVEEAEKLAVLQDVAAVLSTTYGCAYTAVLSEGLDGRGIDVGYLLRSDRVTVDGVRQYQDCTTYDTGLGQGSCPAGQQLLFSRMPLILTTTIQVGPQPGDVTHVTFVANHFKSKRSRSGDPQSAQWRLLQAQSLARWAGQAIAADPGLRLVVMGDLNDFEDSAPLQALYTTGNLTSTWFTLPPDARYSYIYNGRSQILDHILVSPAMFYLLLDTAPLHYNADFPHNPYSDNGSVIWRTSDHDPVAATFGGPDLFGSLKLSAQDGAVAPGDLVTFTVTLSNSSAVSATVVISDPLAAYYAVADAGDLSESPAGTLTWSDVVTAHSQVTLHFVAQVAQDGLGDSVTTLYNDLLLDDGVHTTLTLSDPQPPWAEMHTIYLPLLLRAYAP